jgi:hypothetical protein
MKTLKDSALSYWIVVAALLGKVSKTRPTMSIDVASAMT